jgi:pyruvate, orthophosphate dikinase
MQIETARYVFDFDAPPALPPEELKSLLGGKGASLVVMATELGLPVPPGFIISSEACRAYFAGSWPTELDDELIRHMGRLGERVGRRFGDPVDPLLVSVRSGAPVSMPGMMDTILNLGLNAETARGLARATDDETFAADCLRRFREGYQQVIGTEEVPEDPWLQLRAAVEAVFRSWNSDRAQAYRRREGIAHDLGTAVTVQTMVFGNRGEDSGTGVLFTRDPSTGEARLYGDVMFNAQGEDVVAGGHETEPLSALDQRLPEVAAELRHYADVLERHYADLCDIEFTIEQGRLWMLQVRVGKRSPRAALRMAIDMARDESFPCSREEAVHRVAHLLADPPHVFVRDDEGPRPVASGLPASPGVASGEIVTSSDAAEAAAEEGRKVILVRSETSPEDVRGMARSAGVLTARGGLASHAAVVARGWGIPAVVGADSVEPGDDSIRINGRSLAAGETITIDGSTGEIYIGDLSGSWEVAPEALALQEWARELGIDVPGSGAASESGADVAAEAEAGRAGLTDADRDAALTDEDVLRALLVKGVTELEHLAAAMLAEPDQTKLHVDALVEKKVAESGGAGLRLSSEGKLKALEIFAADRRAFGEERSIEFLESFHDFDVRMKDIVTAWQMREVDGEQVFNDHTDADYDAKVLGDLAALHAETVSWMTPLAQGLRRYAVYRARLERAVELARDGDQRYVASPRVDSYHSVWFELHEDLIRLAGRRRSDEAAAGRA